MKVAIFGGRFDPIHNGHLAVAKEVLKIGLADEVWLSVENQHQWRPIVASAKDRKAMAELAISSVIASKAKQSNTNEEIAASQAPRNDTLKVDMTPVEIGGATETIAVVRRLRQKYPEHEFVFVVGSDNMNVFHKWTHWEELLKEVHFLVVARKGSSVENAPSNATVITDPNYVPLEDSATRIRDLIKDRQSITGLVPESVEKYIIEHKLYS